MNFIELSEEIKLNGKTEKETTDEGTETISKRIKRQRFEGTIPS